MATAPNLHLRPKAENSPERVDENGNRLQVADLIFSSDFIALIFIFLIFLIFFYLFAPRL